MQTPADLLKSSRAAKGFTQQDMADKIQLSLRMYQRYEEGLFPKYKSEQVRRLDELLETNLYDMIYDIKSDNLSDFAVSEPQIGYTKKRQKQKNESAPYLIRFVNRKVQAGYVKSFDQIEYMDTLERYSLPPGVDPRGAEWLYFEIQGDSMQETFDDGDIILCSMVPQVDWQEARNFYVYVIVTEDNIYIKRIFRKSKYTWVLISDNEDNFSQQLIDVESIRQLWVYRRTWHSKAKPPKRFEIKV